MLVPVNLFKLLFCDLKFVLVEITTRLNSINTFSRFFVVVSITTQLPLDCYLYNEAAEGNKVVASSRLSYLNKEIAVRIIVLLFGKQNKTKQAPSTATRR